MAITYEYLIRKLAQQKQKARFIHKTSYGRELETKYGYDRKGHMDEYNRIKTNPDQIVRDYLKN